MAEVNHPITTLSVYFTTGGVAQLPINNIEDLPAILRNLRQAVHAKSVYSVNYANLTWTVNGALIASFEAKHPRLRELVDAWEKENPAPTKWWRFW